MFIKRVKIQNFRIFSDFEIDNIPKPDGVNEGSGLTLIVGENGLGKTSLLDAMTLPVLEYRTDSFSISDLHDYNKKTKIHLFSHGVFEFKAIMPNAGPYKAKGFYFDGGIKSRGSRTYLDKIITTDRKFIRADGETKPKDGSADLRVSVDNPWSGKRFTENDFLYLDKNRTYQIRSGTFNTTRFDRLMEDFDYQYLKSEGKDSEGNQVLPNFPNVDNDLQNIKKVIENDFVTSAVKKFYEISGLKPELSYIDNHQPHKNAFWCIREGGVKQISLSNIGSGYEEVFSLIYSFYLAKQSGKDLIIFIDEPELHLHPKLQGDFAKLLLEFSKEVQIILTSHSSLLVKQLMENEHVEVKVLQKNTDGEIEVANPALRVLPYLSSNEINFIAFNLATEEYHNELYNEIESNFWDNNDFKTLKQNGNYSKNTSRQIVFDNEFFVRQQRVAKDSPWMGKPNMVSIHTYIRNQIHHRAENDGPPDYEDLNRSIIQMRKFIEHNGCN